jgi:hypothetical protein
MSARGYVLSYLALNGAASQASWLQGHLPDTGNPQACLPKARVRAELGHKEELQCVDRW